MVRLALVVLADRFLDLGNKSGFVRHDLLPNTRSNNSVFNSAGSVRLMVSTVRMYFPFLALASSGDNASTWAFRFSSLKNFVDVKLDGIAFLYTDKFLLLFLLYFIHGDEGLLAAKVAVRLFQGTEQVVVGLARFGIVHFAESVSSGRSRFHRWSFASTVDRVRLYFHFGRKFVREIVDHTDLVFELKILLNIPIDGQGLLRVGKGLAQDLEIIFFDIVRKLV